MKSLQEVKFFKERGAQLRVREGEASPALFMKMENSIMIQERKCSDCVHLWNKFFIQIVVLRVSRTKTSKVFSCGVFFLVRFWRNVYWGALIPRNLHCPGRFFDEPLRNTRFDESASKSRSVFRTQASICDGTFSWI